VTLLALLPSLLAAQPTGSIAGRVVDSTGSALPGATVSLIGAGPAAEGPRITAADGSFAFDNVPAGDYLVEAALSGFEPRGEPVSVEADAVARVDLTLEISRLMESITVVAEAHLACVPLFFGANPAEVRHGQEKGLRILSVEEDLARGLLGQLTPDQRRVAIVDPQAPDDILTKNYRAIQPGMAPQGLAFGDMAQASREQLVRLIRHYVDRSAGEMAANAWRDIEHAGLDPVTFAWAGPQEPGHGHYYAVVGSTFLIEYDNTQDGANHVHSVWRDFTNDFGGDVLAEHYAESAHHHDHE